MSGTRLPVLLVNPSARTENYGKLNVISAIEPPLWCAMLAGYIRRVGLGVDILDAEVGGLTVRETAKAIVDINPRLAVIVVMGPNPSVSSTPKMDAVKALVQDIKVMQSDVKVMISGLHPSALPARTLSETGADYVCEGEGFYTITNTAAALNDGAEPKDIPGLWSWLGTPLAKEPLMSPSLLRLPAWDLLPMESYRAHNWQCLGDLDHRSPYGVIATSFGCPFGCSYCNIHALYGGERVVRERLLSDVLTEIDYLVDNYGIRNIKIWDEMFTLKESRILALCDAIIDRRYDLNLWAYGRVGTVTPRMIERMKKAGINWICYGFESAVESVRQGVGKNTTEANFLNAVYECRQNDVHILANYLFGLPDDTLETMQATLQEAKSANFEWVNLYCAAPMPGSQLWEQTDDSLLPETWADYGQYSPKFVPLPTKTLTGREVLAFRDMAFKEYSTRKVYLEMIQSKFGRRAHDHVLDVLRLEVERGRQ
jgi:radical SAM superfamily enzyme YgiQ (UPF0313 family)